jgi:hypothetical protein
MQYLDEEIEIRVHSIIIDLDYIEANLLEEIDAFEKNLLKYKSKVVFQNCEFDFTDSHLGVLKKDNKRISGSNVINISITNTMK